ncbi:MAG: DUF2029 domain-containing protein [Planctomycetes bacterium]|nr:DUF2029 domain-containing protein [Planctomycetota bacterium]MCW8137246.1 DUF2029 domain-containing protein [Planctomycetota bacterium]
MPSALKLLLLCAGLALAGLAVALPGYWQDYSMDIAVYWEAAERMRSGGEHLYADAEDPHNRVGLYIYPPLLAALMAPVTWLPRGAGYAVWALAQWLFAAGALLAVARMCSRAVWRQGRMDPGLPAFLAPLVVAVFGAAWINFSEGQVNFLLLLLLASGLWQLEEGRTLRGGLLLAAAAHLKVIPIVLLLVLLAQRRFKAALAMLAGCALLWLLPLVWTVPAHGLDGLGRNVQLSREYTELIVSPHARTQSPDNLGGVRAPNNSLGAVVNRYFGDGQRLSNDLPERAPLLFTAPEPLRKWGGFGLGCLLFGAALVLAALRRDTRHSRNAAAGLALLSAALGNLLFWPHHLALLLLALGPLLAAGRTRLAWGLCAAVLLFCFVPMIDRWGGPLAWVQVVGVPTATVLSVWTCVWITFARRGIAGQAAPPILPRHEETPARDPAA